MGNKICGRRRPVEERLTRPQRILRQPSDVDYKKLRKLILSEKLAPCFDAADSPDLSFSAGADDLEECPICFLYYPSLNRSRCCAKGICTECFLQMKPSRTTQSAQCPFCKTSCYAVEYHGARTEEEKVLEWAEEQKVIEAKLRIQYESQIEEQVIGPQSLVELLPSLSNAERPSTGDNAQQECSIVQESLEVDGSSDLSTCRTWHEEAVDLEEIMLMEAIWQSLQDSRLQQGESSSIGGRSCGENSPGASTLSDYRGEPFSYCSLAEGVAIAIAKLAKLNIMRPHISELDCETIQTQRNLHETIICDLNSTQQETGCSSSSSLRTVDLPSRLAAELNAS